jgi:hypothetical protein
VVGASGEKADISIGVPHPVFGNAPWTQQSQGCGQPGDMIYLSYRQLQNIGKYLHNFLVTTCKLGRIFVARNELYWLD